MKWILKFLVVLFFAALFFGSCKKTDEVRLPVPAILTTQFPLPNAGNDQIIVLPKSSVTLNGSGSVDRDGKIVSYLWTQISGPGQVVIANPTVAVTTISGFVEGVYNFKLKITDNDGAVSEDLVEIIFIKDLAGFEYIFRQSWSSNDGAGADNDVYVTTPPLPDLFSVPNIPLEVSILPDPSTVWIVVPKDTSALAVNSKYFYVTGSGLYVYASYPGSYSQLIGKGVTVKIKFL